MTKLRVLSLWLSIGFFFLNASCSTLMVATRDEEKAKVYLQLAADQFNERQYNEAIQSTQQALQLYPDMPEAYNHLALIYMETKRFDKSEEAFLKALSLKEDYSEVHNNLGVLYNRQEKYSEAVIQFEKALQDEAYRTPENALTNLGYAYFKLENIPKAKEQHQKALDVVPQFCLAHKNLADIYVKEKNYQKAADYYQNSVTYCPLYQESQYKLGLVMMKLGQKQVARNQLEKLVSRHKTGPYVERSQQVLKYLK